MTPARMEEIRRDIDREAYTSYLPKTVRELLDYIGELQRGGAVVVPAKMDDDDWEAVGFQQSTEGQIQRVWDRAISHIQPIPADRVLGNGMVGVDREELDALRSFYEIIRCHMMAEGGIPMSDALGAAMDSLDAIRSAKGEVK